MNHKEFKNLMQMQMDCIVNGTGHILLYFGFSIYFILALSGDYDVPVYMANLSAAIAMAFVFYAMVRFTRREGEHWRSMYEKIKYFPINRKKYLLSQMVPAAKVIGLQLLIQWAVFGCRILMHRGIPLESMGLVSVHTAAGGGCFCVGFIGLMVIGERALYLFPLLFGAGLGLANLVGNLIIR